MTSSNLLIEELEKMYKLMGISPKVLTEMKTKEVFYENVLNSNQNSQKKLITEGIGDKIYDFISSQLRSVSNVAGFGSRAFRFLGHEFDSSEAQSILNSTRRGVNGQIESIDTDALRNSNRSAYDKLIDILKKVPKDSSGKDIGNISKADELFDGFIEGLQDVRNISEEGVVKMWDGMKRKVREADPTLTFDEVERTALKKILGNDEFLTDLFLERFKKTYNKVINNSENIPIKPTKPKKTLKDVAPELVFDSNPEKQEEMVGAFQDWLNKRNPDWANRTTKNKQTGAIEDVDVKVEPGSPYYGKIGPKTEKNLKDKNLVADFLNDYHSEKYANIGLEDRVDDFKKFLYEKGKISYAEYIAEISGDNKGKITELTKKWWGDDSKGWFLGKTTKNQFINQTMGKTKYAFLGAGHKSKFDKNFNAWWTKNRIGQRLVGTTGKINIPPIFNTVRPLMYFFMRKITSLFNDLDGEIKIIMAKSNFIIEKMARGGAELDEILSYAQDIQISLLACKRGYAVAGEQLIEDLRTALKTSFPQLPDEQVTKFLNSVKDATAGDKLFEPVVSSTSSKNLSLTSQLKETSIGKIISQFDSNPWYKAGATLAGGKGFTSFLCGFLYEALNRAPSVLLTGRLQTVREMIQTLVKKGIFWGTVDVLKGALVVHYAILPIFWIGAVWFKSLSSAQIKIMVDEKGNVVEQTTLDFLKKEYYNLCLKEMDEALENSDYEAMVYAGLPYRFLLGDLINYSDDVLLGEERKKWKNILETNYKKNLNETGRFTETEIEDSWNKLSTTLDQGINMTPQGMINITTEINTLYGTLTSKVFENSVEGFTAYLAVSKKQPKKDDSGNVIFSSVEGAYDSTGKGYLYSPRFNRWLPNDETERKTIETDLESDYKILFKKNIDAGDEELSKTPKNFDGAITKYNLAKTYSMMDAELLSVVDNKLLMLNIERYKDDTNKYNKEAGDYMTKNQKGDAMKSYGKSLKSVKKAIISVESAIDYFEAQKNSQNGYFKDTADSKLTELNTTKTELETEQKRIEDIINNG